MARFVAQESPLDTLERLLPNIIILLILVLALLAVLTKFGWIHCSQVPGFDWCGTYCTYIEQGKSRVLVLYGNDGLGDPVSLRAQLSRLRGFSLVEPLQAVELSAGILKKYDLIIVEKFKTASTRQVEAIQGYLDSGGVLVWAGDAFSNQYVDEYDLLLARQKNETFYLNLIAYNITPNTTEWNKAWAEARKTTWYKHLNNLTKYNGFDVLEGYLGARYDSVVNVTNASFRIVDPDHLTVKGLFKQFPTLAKRVTKVVPDASRTNLLAQVITENATLPGVIETRYAGKIVYVSFPLEEANSTTFLINLLDYLAPC
ncbi:MAG: hypothetical protein V1717_04590 [Candidatus Micrarchaeota archaeon]